MNPQKNLNELFLDDLLRRIADPEADAVDCFMRLRLYVCATNYDGTLRELLRARGVSAAAYDALLGRYNRQLAGRGMGFV